MKNIEKYKKVFTDSLSLNDQNIENLKYNEIPEWDSIGHMTLMSGLEETFNISLETDDIVDFSSFKKGIEILKNIRLIEKSMQKELFYENFKKQLIKRGFKEGDTILLTCDILKFLLYFRKKIMILMLINF